MSQSTTSLRDKFEREATKQQSSEKPKIPTKPVDPQGENIAASKKFFEAKIKAEKPKVNVFFRNVMKNTEIWCKREKRIFTKNGLNGKSKSKSKKLKPQKHTLLVQQSTNRFNA
jgi:hypothetical protein